MDNASYTALTRQSGLMREMQIVANNIANAATTGFRQEGLIFSERLQKTGDSASVSMATGNVRQTSMIQGTFTQTGGSFDLAIEGDGFFLIETERGERLTRAGNFSPDSNGNLVTSNGHRVLDSGGAPVFVPTDASELSISPDGTISTKGRPIGQIGLYQPVNTASLVREDGVMFRSEEGFEAAPNSRMMQGFLEGSNVDPVSQIARMIEVQRAYEMGQSFLQTEDERVRNALKSITR